ncbi:hypothetical protein CRYUN_Cryun33cG0101200 [Craigia yunnanensis]
MLRIEVEDLVTPRASLEKPRRSSSLSLPSLVVFNGFSRKSFSYSKLPNEPIKLSVRKLDGSSFDVEVIKSATIAELKLAVQNVFSHMPKKGPGKVSWPHVWGHFCLCYDGQKLVTDTDHIVNYGIRDGDQLHFIRHLTSSYNHTKIQSKRRIVARKQSYLSISSSTSSLESEQNDEDDDMENGKCQSLNDKNQSMIVQQDCKFGHLWTENPTPVFLKSQQILSLSSSTLKSISLLTVTSLSFAPPSLAEEIEKAALFDFNLTLPIMMVQFLLLMFALDKIYFTPLGNFMDERDSAIKAELAGVKDTSEEVKQLEEQAAAIMRAARAEISAALNKMKKETQLEVEQKLAEGRKKVEAELQEALANLEKQKEETIKSLDSQIATLSQDIVKKVLPL